MPEQSGVFRRCGCADPTFAGRGGMAALSFLIG
jgi:hypothetical protein